MSVSRCQISSLMPVTVRILCYDTEPGYRSDFIASISRRCLVVGRANMSELAYSARAVDLHLLVDSRCFEASKASDALHDASSSNTHTPPRALR